MGDDKDKDVDFHWPADMETKEEALYLPIRPSTHSSSISPSINSTIIFRAHVLYESEQRESSSRGHR